MQILKDIYLVHVDGYIGSYLPRKNYPIIGYADKEKFVDFCQSLREDFPEYRLRCVDNDGIRILIRDRIMQDRIMAQRLERGR